jgi:hypothetical protein
MLEKQRDGRPFSPAGNRLKNEAGTRRSAVLQIRKFAWGQP